MPIVIPVNPYPSTQENCLLRVGKYSFTDLQQKIIEFSGKVQDNASLPKPLIEEGYDQSIYVVREADGVYKLYINRKVLIQNDGGLDYSLNKINHSNISKTAACFVLRIKDTIPVPPQPLDPITLTYATASPARFEVVGDKTLMYFKILVKQGAIAPAYVRSDFYFKILVSNTFFVSGGS